MGRLFVEVSDKNLCYEKWNHKNHFITTKNMTYLISLVRTIVDGHFCVIYNIF